MACVAHTSARGYKVTGRGRGRPARRRLAEGEGEGGEGGLCGGLRARATGRGAEGGHAAEACPGAGQGRRAEGSGLAT